MSLLLLLRLTPQRSAELANRVRSSGRKRADPSRYRYKAQAGVASLGLSARSTSAFSGCIAPTSRRFSMESTIATADVIDQLRQGVATLTSTDQWTRWLRVQRRFYHYSWRNSLLIMMQRPDATRVGGYHTWTSVGRQVRKGEHGIAILAPIVPRLRVKDEDEDGRERILLEHPTAFLLALLFDLTQAEGDALPEVVSRLIGDDAGSRFAGLVKVAAT